MSVSFSELGLSKPVLDAIADQGYETPSPIQAQAIGAVLSGKDVMAAAQTGTGKTGAFALPIVHMLNAHPQRPKPNHVKALILTPTRELAAQVAQSVLLSHKYTNMNSTVAFGGVSINPQLKSLRKGSDVLTATPGRLLDLYSQNAIKFTDLSILVLDEADRMLDMGFIHDLKRIMKLLPTKRQTLLFSATFSDDIRQLAKQFIKDPIEISVTPKNAAATTVEQHIVHVDKSNKSKLLATLIADNKWQQVLVFSRTKHGANRIAKQLNAKGLTSLAIHGNKSQGARTKALSDFKSGNLRVLVATDIAARGIDIDLLPNVVNYDLPHVPEDYVHRIGRTGRAGATGSAVSFVTNEDGKQLKAIQNLIGQHINVLEVAGLSEKPSTQAPIRAPKPKRPKRVKRD
ncbi:DEAD/DEAH box helicase [Glaciecola sp. SC05]|uniref:DEAD/DEAH box helicase n=1 Tax=Glaciecola sp. SC05 TaxID=1987355 RepID=UPI003528D4AF